MQVALLGIPGAGVKTAFSAITGLGVSGDSRAQSFGAHRISVLQVPDPRLEFVAAAFQPGKTVPAAIQITEFPGLFGVQPDAQSLARCREADGLAFVLRSFESASLPHIRGRVDPARDLRALEEDVLLADLEIVETRLRRLEAALQKRKDPDEEREMQLLGRCRERLEGSQPLGGAELTKWEDKRLRGFGFLSLKPSFVLLNIGDEQIKGQQDLVEPFLKAGYSARAICADIESELARLQDSERLELMQDFGIEELATPVVLQGIFQALDLVTFYTYRGDECRAWTIYRGQTAVDAAGRVHTDLATGFIRAEVIGFDDFQALGDLKSVRAAGKLRLEGRDYPVEDGDLIQIRHS